MPNAANLPRPKIKYTHPKCVNFDGVRVGSIFFVFRLIIVQCGEWSYGKFEEKIEDYFWKYTALRRHLLYNGNILQCLQMKQAFLIFWQL